MRKFISLLFTLMLVVTPGLVTAVPVAASPDPRTLEVSPRTLPTIVLDGLIDVGEWGTPDFTGTQTNPGPVEFNIYVENDDANLYIAAEYVSGDFSVAQGLGLATALNIYIDANPPTPFDGVVDNGDLAVIASNDEIFIPYDPGANDWDWQGSGSFSAAGGQIAVDGDYMTGNGIVEVKIPFSMMGALPGDTIGLLFQAFGNDSCPVVPDVHPNWPETYTPLTLPPFSTIQAAINAADPGDTVNVAAGTYEENIVIPNTMAGAGLQLLGAGKTSSIISITSGTAISVGSKNALMPVTIQGFGFDGNNGNYAIDIRASGNSGTPSVIANNSFENFRFAIKTADIGVSYWNIKNNDFDGNRLPIYITGSYHEISGNVFGNYKEAVSGDWDYAAADHLTIKDNQFLGGIHVMGADLLPATVLQQAAILFSTFSHDVSVTANEITNSTTGVLVKHDIRDDQADLSNVTVKFNNITGSTNGVLVEGTPNAVLDAKYNWWGDASGPYLVNGLGSKISPYVDARVWLDAPYPGGETTALKVGESYNLYLTGLGDSVVVYLDDIGNDALAPTDPDSPGSDSLYAVPDAFQYTLSAQGTKIISGVSPQYGTYTGVSGTEDAEYIGIAYSPSDELWMLEVLPADVVTITSDVSSFTYNTGITFTATVEKSGEPLLTMVEVYVDNTGTGALTALVTEGGTDPSGEVEFTLTDEQVGAAGSLVLYVLGGDVGGLLGSPTVTDGVDDVAPAKLALTIGPLEVDVATQPSQLFANFPTLVTVTATYDGVAFNGAAVVLDGAGLDEFSLGTTSDGEASATITPGEIGTIAVTVSRDDEGATPPVNEYLGTATIAVILAEDLNVTVAEEWVIADYTHAGGNLDVTIQGSDANGPDGSGDNELDYVDIVVTGPNVNYSLAKAYWTGTAWDLSEGDLPTGVSGVDSDTIRFLIAPNMANEDVDVELTGYTYADTTFTEVGAATETVTVLGYALYNYPTEDIEVDQTAGLSLDVKTKDGVTVNSATVTIVADADNAFGKDFDDSGEIEAGEKFAQITIGDNLITYAGTGETEVYYVNNGHYEVTDITFLALAAVSIDIRDAETPTIAAFLDPAFSIIIIGVDVYSFTFEPAKLTAGVDLDTLEITITDNETEPVTDVATISINGKDYDVSGQTPEDGVYEVDPLLYTEVDTLDVIASNEGASKYGTDTLEVGLPSVERTFTEVGKITKRNVMLTGQTYTVSVNVTDALGGALDGYVWLGTYAEETFTPVDSSQMVTAGIGEFAVTPSVVGTLVWKVGSGNEVTNAALVLELEPSIAVEALSLSLDWIPEAPIVDGEITFTVTNNYGDPAGNRDIKIVSPGGDLTEKVTTPEGVFKYTATEDGDYYVSVKFDATTWQDPVTVTVVVTRLAEITAAPESVSLYVGETEQLLITATYEDESTDNVTADATYASDNESVATVSDAGLITAVAEGEATITVTYTEGVITKTTDVLVTVSEVPVLVSIAASPLSVSLNVSETEQLTITATYSDGTADVTADATYASDNVSVATVSTGGLITAVAEGEAAITVTYTEDEITVTTDVSVTVEVVVPVTWSCPLDHEALIAPYPAMGRPFLSTGAGLSEVSSDDWFQVLWLDESTGVWKSFYSGFAENTLLTLEPEQYYYVIVSAAPCDLTIPH